MAQARRTVRKAVGLRDELLAELEGARRELLAAADGLGGAQITRPMTEGGWSVKDTLAHVSSWDELRCFEVARVARGDEPLYAGLQEEDFASWNAGLMSVRRDLPLHQVLRELSYAREHVLAVISAVPDEHLPDVAPGRVRIRRAAAHDREHAEAIREWRKREGL